MRILYFVENNWVFGKIFNELIKHLFPIYDGDIFDWGSVQDRENTDRMQAKYDLFFSTPVGCFFLHDTYGIPLSRCYGHVHQDFDIVDALRRFPREYFDQLAGYGVVSPVLQHISLSRELARIPTVLPVGVTAANYRRSTPPTKIEKLGYFGRMHRADSGFDIKRGHLAKVVAEQAGITLWNREQVPFFVADRLYHEVDLVMFCSLIEGNPYMALEACAAGVPTLGTAAGLFPEIAQAGAGFVLPFEEDLFVAHAVAAIQTLRDNPTLYASMCSAAARLGETFDWSVIKTAWLKEFQRVIR